MAAFGESVAQLNASVTEGEFIHHISFSTANAPLQVGNNQEL
jgi:hypothetical protein